MRILTKYEYDLALAIIIKHFTDWDLCEKFTELTKMEWLETPLYQSINPLLASLYLFLEIPESDIVKDLESLHEGYSRDWLIEIQCLVEDYFEDQLTLEQRAKLFLDLLILINTKGFQNFQDTYFENNGSLKVNKVVDDFLES